MCSNDEEGYGLPWLWKPKYNVVHNDGQLILFNSREGLLIVIFSWRRNGLRLARSRGQAQFEGVRFPFLIFLLRCAGYF